MPRDLFEEFGIEESPQRDLFEDFGVLQNAQETPPENVRGWRGVGKDVAEGVTGIPAAAWNILKGAFVNAPGEIMGLGEQAMREPTRPLRELATGALDVPVALGNIPAYAEKYFRSKFGDPTKQTLSIMENPFESLLGTKEQKPGSAMMRLAGSLGSAGPLSEVGPATGMARMGQRAGVAGGMAAGEGENPLTAVGLTGAIEGGIRGVGKTMGGLPGRATPAEVAERMQAAEGTNVPLYEIIDSPAMKATQENLLDQLLLSGADKRSARLRNQVTDIGNELFNEGILPENRTILNETFYDELSKAFNNSRRVKNELYEPVSTMMQQEGVNLNLKNTRNMIDEWKEVLQDSPLYKSNPRFKSSVNKLAGFDEVGKAPKQTTGQLLTGEKPTPQYPTMSEALGTAADMWKEGYELKKSANRSDKMAGQVMQDVANAVRDDVKKTINSEGSQKLKEAYMKATDNYKENYAPFIEDDVQKLLKDPNKADSAARSIIKQGAGDKYKNIQKFNDLMPPDQKMLLGKAYLSQALDKNGNLNLKKLKQAISKLGPNEFEALFPDPAIRTQLNNFENLIKMGGKSLDELFIPKTGITATQAGVKLAQLGTIGQQLFGGHPLMAGATLGLGGLANISGKTLSSPKFRKWYVDNYLNPGNISGSAAKYPTKAALVQPEEK